MRRIELGRRPDVLNTHLDNLRTYSATGKWFETIAEATIVLELTKGKHSEALNHRGKGLRCINNQYAAVLDFQTAIRLARKQKDPEQEVIAGSNLVDAWRTSIRDKTFPFPEQYQTVEEKREYGLQQAVRWAKVTQSAINRMPEGASEGRSAAYDQFGLVFIEPGIRDYQKALNAYIAAGKALEEIAEKDPTKSSLQERIARNSHLQGIALENLGRLPEAEAAQRKSLVMSTEVKHTTNIINAATGLGDVLVKLGRKSEGLGCYELADETFKKDGKLAVGSPIHLMIVERLARPI